MIPIYLFVSLFCDYIVLIGSFSNDDGDGGDDTLWKMNLYFTFESRSSALFSTPIGLKTCSGSTCTDSAEFQKKIPKISHCGLRFPKYIELSRCCFAENVKEMYQDSKCVCVAIVLLIKPFVWCRSRRRRRRRLLKLTSMCKRTEISACDRHVITLLVLLDLCETNTVPKGYF